MDTHRTVFILDDDDRARESVAMLVSTLGYQAQTFVSAEDFLSQLQPGDRGCIISDENMDGISGIELVKKITKQQINLPVIIVTGFGDIPLAVEALQSGAVTFLQKPCTGQEIESAIRMAMQKEAENYEEAIEKEELRSRLSTLKDTERLVLEKILEGKPNKVIKRELDIGLRTAELRRSRVMKKMQANSLAELVRMAITAGVQVNKSA